MDTQKFTTVQEYIKSQPIHLQPILQQMRQIISAAAPQATEVISYGMPAIKQGKVLVYFAAAKAHLGFYPSSTGVSAFLHKLNDYEVSKGAIRLPFSKPLPESLITEIVQYRLASVMAEMDAKKKKKKP